MVYSVVESNCGTDVILRILTHPKNSTAFPVLSFWVGVHISCHTESREIRRIRVRHPKNIVEFYY